MILTFPAVQNMNGQVRKSAAQRGNTAMTPLAAFVDEAAATTRCT